MIETWRELRQRPSHLAVLLLCAVVLVAHQGLRWDWFIEDAAICFSYARNLVNGEGFVPWPGAERIEGISDPAWMVLLVAFQAVGLDGFEVAKPLAMVLGVLCLPLTWRAARLAMPDHDGPAPLFAPISVAVSAQMAIWSASGLENSLFCLLLAWALIGTVEAPRTGRFLHSALPWFLLAWTRPEGLLYAAVGGAWFAIWTLRGGHGWRPIARWLALFWLPSLLLEALRLWYFAWPLPNTWYAKVGVRDLRPWSWNSRGWNQLQEYARRLWVGWYLPVYLVGLTGTRGRAAIAGGIAAGLVLVSLAWPGPGPLTALSFWPALPPPPPGWLTARVVLLIAAGVGLPFAALGLGGWRMRVLCWHSAIVSVLFSVYANGDWMGGFRWMSLLVVPASVLLAVGIRELADRFEAASGGGPAWGTVGWTTAAFGVCLLLPPNLNQSRDHALHNRNETPTMVLRRVRRTAQVARMTFLEEPIVNLDMDMGAHLWWRPDYRNLDMAGLVDVPMSRHTYEDRAFIQEYVFQEHRPHFGHVHGWWATNSGFKTYPAWDAYFELPPYEDVLDLPPHQGVWARRDLLMERRWSGLPGRRILYPGGRSLEGWDAPVPAWGSGAAGFLELGVKVDPQAPGVRVVAFLSDGTSLASWELPMGLGLLPSEKWNGETFHGRFSLPVRLPPGTYDLGFVVFGADGEVLAPLEDGVPEGAVVAGLGVVAARFARGEVRFPGAVEVLPAEEAEARKERAVQVALDAAASGACSGAERSWVLAKRHRPDDARWAWSRLPEVSRALGACWARDAVGTDDPVPALARAHRWDHRSPELASIGAPVGDRLWAEGMAARASGDWETAYARFQALLSFQPWRSWARRYAEEARDHRLEGRTVPKRPEPKAPALLPGLTPPG